MFTLISDVGFCDLVFWILEMLMLVYGSWFWDFGVWTLNPGF